MTVSTSLDLWTNDAWPQCTLVEAADGSFYGTAEQSVLRITRDGGVTVVARNLDQPRAGVIKASDGGLYGTTYYGGAYNKGCVFRLSPSGDVSTLVSFNDTNGCHPQGGLIQGKDGNLYGTTEGGGVYTNVNRYGSTGYGTIFKVTLAGSLTTLCSLDGTNGYAPEAALVQGTDGNFYGTTVTGGSAGDGAAFRVTPEGLYACLWSFSWRDGNQPYGALLQASDGNLYGTTYGGDTGGIVYRLSTPMAAAFLGIGIAGGFVTTSWSSVAGQVYQVQYSTNMSEWVDVGSPTTATNGIISIDQPVGAVSMNFYRVFVLP